MRPFSVYFFAAVRHYTSTGSRQKDNMGREEEGASSSSPRRRPVQKTESYGGGRGPLVMLPGWLSSVQHTDRESKGKRRERERAPRLKGFGQSAAVGLLFGRLSGPISHAAGALNKKELPSSAAAAAGGIYFDRAETEIQTKRQAKESESIRNVKGPRVTTKHSDKTVNLLYVRNCELFSVDL
jgi:hypothetical protein